MRNFQPTWISLPDLVLVEVFKYLSDVERANAALVCQGWNRVFKSPCLWRTRSFEMGGYKAQVHGARACSFASTFGQYLRYLSISCSHPSYHTCKLFQKSIDELLVILKDSETQLVDFELCRLELERYWKYDTHRDKLVSIFSKFLKTQRRLQCFDMSCAQFPAFGGCRVLDAIANQSGSTLQDLMIEDFFHSRLSVYPVKKFHKVISKFTDLKYLAINYNCLSDEVLEIFSKSLQKKLHFLNIKVSRNDPHLHRISGYAWKQFTRACPCLRVAVWFESVGMYSEISSILVKEAPVKDLHIWSGYDDDSDWRLSETIDHIADSYANVIDSVSLELDNTQEIIDHSVMQLVTKCKKLKELSINALVSMETVENICELLRERRIDLKELLLTCCGLTEIEWEILQTFRDKYQPIFNSRKIIFRCSSDLIIESL